jgi:hypothetical protein
MNVELRQGKRNGWMAVIWASVAMLLLASCSSSSPDILTQCVSHDNLDGHIHVTLVTVWNGQPEFLSANIGVTPDCLRPTHTHDESSAVHIETPDDRKYTVGDFFRVWGAESPAMRPGAEVENVSLNGEPYTDDYRDIVFEDGQRIVIALGDRTPKS